MSCTDIDVAWRFTMLSRHLRCPVKYLRARVDVPTDKMLKYAMKRGVGMKRWVTKFSL